MQLHCGPRGWNDDRNRFWPFDASPWNVSNSVLNTVQQLLASSIDGTVYDCWCYLSPSFTIKHAMEHLQFAWACGTYNACVFDLGSVPWFSSSIARCIACIGLISTCWTDRTLLRFPAPSTSPFFHVRVSVAQGARAWSRNLQYTLYCVLSQYELYDERCVESLLFLLHQKAPIRCAVSRCAFTQYLFVQKA